jgi:hypothetical protein
MNNRLVIVTGVGLAAVLMVSTLLQARPQAPHLPAVGEYGTVLAYSVVLDGDDACIGTTTGIAIVRIANAVSIENLASIDTLGDSRCVVAGRYAYVNSVSDLAVVDVSNRTSPRIVGRHRGRARYSHVQVSGRYAYAVVSTGGLDVIDVRDATRPTLVGAVSWTGTEGRVCVRGQTAYVSRGEGGVRIVDVSQATAPTVVGEVAFDGRGGLIALVNAHLAIATERGVCLYDISAPRTPVMRKLLTGRLSDVCSDGDRTLFVHSRGVTMVFDVSNIDSPRVLGTIGEYFHDLTRRGDLVFGVMSGLKVYRLGAGARDETDQEIIRAATGGDLAKVCETVEKDPSHDEPCGRAHADLDVVLVHDPRRW